MWRWFEGPRGALSGGLGWLDPQVMGSPPGSTDSNRTMRDSLLVPSLLYLKFLFIHSEGRRANPFGCMDLTQLWTKLRLTFPFLGEPKRARCGGAKCFSPKPWVGNVSAPRGGWES